MSGPAELMLWAVAVLVVAVVTGVLLVIAVAVVKAFAAPRRTDRQIQAAAEAEIGSERAAMGMPWASRDGLREAIPPAYTEFIGRQLLAHIGAVSEE